MIKVVIKKSQRCFKLLCCGGLFFLAGSSGFAQAKLVLNGAKINLTNNSYLVLANPAADAIIRHNGHIIGEGENNSVKWQMGTNTGSYLVPWGFGASAYLPLSFTKSAGSGPGYLLFSTYQTGWQNSLSLPEGVTNLAGSIPDNSAFVVDRFWRVDAREYTEVPALTNVNLSYLESEVSAEGNSITESSLGIQGWNEDTESWGDFPPAGTADINTHTLTAPSLPARDAYSWYTLVDRLSPLPLDFVSFAAKRSGKAVKLNWVTANEINCVDFEIQRSSDGIYFSALGTRPAANSHLNTYHYTDNYPLPGTSYYRLKQNDIDGKFAYSPIRSITIAGMSEMNIYPNPSPDHKLVIYMGEAPLNKYVVNLFDQQGRPVFEEVKNIDQQVFFMQFPASLPTGMYLLRISNAAFSKQMKVVFK